SRNISAVRIAAGRSSGRDMRMSRNFSDAQRVGLLATLFAQRMTTAHVNRCLTNQIRQSKVHPPVAAISRTQQTEERLVLINRQQLTVAKGPTLGCEVKAEDSDFR